MIRRMEPSDIEAVAEIWLAANLDAHSFIPADYWRANFAPVKAALAEAEVYIYEDAGGIEGFIGLSGEHIEGLFINAPARSHGIGRRLLELVKSMKPRLSLNVYAANTRALNFYRREGFSVSGTGTDPATGAGDCFMTWEKGAP